MRVALVHEWLTKLAGSERVLAELMKLHPDAPVFCSVHDPDISAGTFLAGRDIRPSFISRLPMARTRYPWYLPLMPLAVERHDLSEYDLVISSHHAMAKGVITRADQLHISYVHTPMRYAWDLSGQYVSGNGVGSFVKRLLLHRLRQWDVISANRVDVFVANSRTVAGRIRKTYRREAEVIFPPVEVGRFQSNLEREDFYLVVSRLVSYKKIDLIARAFTRLDRPLILIGEGSERERIARVCGANVRMLGYQDDATVAGYMQRCRAFVHMAEEDFGITVVEAQAAGAPVIAYGRGGCGETVRHGKTGILFAEQTVDGLIGAVRAFEESHRSFDSESIAESVRHYNPRRFRDEFTALVERSREAFHRSGG